MARVIWFKKSQGLATKFDPVRIEYTEKLGVKHLAEAYNVDFDFTGAISRRKGFVASGVTGVSHSFFCNGGDCLFVQDNALYELGSDMSAKWIRGGMTSDVSYCQVGDAIVYMDGQRKGIVSGGSNFTYIMPPSPRTPDQTRVYNDPPIGSIVRSFAGRVWVVVGKVLFYSEPFSPNIFRLSTNYITLPAEITIVAPVQGGLFVSTTAKVYFFAGTNPKEFVQSTVAHYPGIKGTDVTVDGIAVDAGQITPLPAQMFTTTEGICIGTADGRLVNLTYGVLEYPGAIKGSAVYTGDRYIVSLDGDTSNLTLCLSLGAVAPSQYANFNFDSMCKFKDKIVGGNSNGVYTLLSGDDDAGEDINAHFRTGATSFGVENEKRLRRLYISMRSSGLVKASVAGDDKEDVTKEITPYDDKLKIIHQEIQGGRDIKGKYLDLKISNVNGSDFTVAEIQALLIVRNAKTTEVL